MGNETNTGDLIKKSFSEHTQCDARGGLAGARAFKDGPSLGKVVREHARQVRVAGPRPRERAVSSNLALVSRTRVNEQV